MKIVVPFAPGGGTDVMARNIAQKLYEAWAQAVVVENRTGAGGITANAREAEAAKAFIRFISAPAAAPIYAAKGLGPN